MSKLPVVPSLDAESGLSRYLREIRKFRVLGSEEEYTLAKRWREHGDSEAAATLVTSHLRLVAKIARGYRGYGLPLGEIISEGNVGLMRAVKRFEPDKGFRLATYAMWWIRAAMQEYVLRSWSLVKIGTTAAQKKLFFNIRRLKGEIRAMEGGDLRPEHVEKIAAELDVDAEDVIGMNRRMLAPDASLNVPVSQETGGGEWQDWLADESPNQETLLAAREETEERRRLLREAMGALNDREREILAARRLRDAPVTLEELGRKHGVSRERVRQIEMRAFEKLQKAIRSAVADAGGRAEAAVR